jgi:hypothetical protein
MEYKSTQFRIPSPLESSMDEVNCNQTYTISSSGNTIQLSIVYKQNPDVIFYYLPLYSE